MKLRLLSMVLFLCTLSASAQTQQELEKGTAEMYTNTIKGNYEALMEQTYPKIFELVPKEQMLELLQSMLNGDGYKMIIMDTPPNFKYGPVKKIGQGSYSLIKHDLKMKMIFDEKMTKEEADQMVETFKQAMQTQEVTFTEADNSVTIKKTADVIAIADKLTDNKWKFLNRSGDPMMKKLLSEEVLKGLGI